MPSKWHLVSCWKIIEKTHLKFIIKFTTEENPFLKIHLSTLNYFTKKYVSTIVFNNAILQKENYSGYFNLTLSQVIMIKLNWVIIMI